MDFQNLLRGADRHEHLEHCHGGVRCGAECGQPVGGVIISDAGIDISSVTADLETQLADWSIGALLGLWFQSIFVGLCTQILSICIFLVIYGRIIEVYLVTSIGPSHLPRWSTGNGETQGRTISVPLLALGFQAFLIMICVGIYAVLVEGISTSGDNISGCYLGVHGVHGASVLYSL